MIVVERIAPDGTAHRISIRGHELIADMSAPDGHDTGPDPHDLYDSALGACKGMTMLWYAQRNGIPLEGIHVGVERDNSRERQGVYRLTTRIALSGPMTDEQYGKLIAVAAKCPVHKLMSEVRTEIDTIAVPRVGDPEGR
ncbi:putative redox protein [Sphingobium wenxiniae]|jgi:putative redox protein|uniref:Osmc family protein n=2 Tax=Sphingobium TaxID=165695 RepID=T0HMB3_9SPHN|nr:MULTISPECIES: OsmC family protein [Sphingobium]EQA98703.1 osmc family protein [Sphingobium baderi LL03]KMS61341.1 osmc family protein [Sphingobium baderi LL03]MBB6191039.1 putative redox protein [Sphingobium wenxiniae]TWH93655.1 putative redox protein [Sphingobium wenxiniae]WRD75557.1 OsmC family protein [Sphingobium baderi]